MDSLIICCLISRSDTSALARAERDVVSSNKVNSFLMVLFKMIADKITIILYGAY